MYSGPEIEVRFDDLVDRVPDFPGSPENQIVTPEAGDVMLVFLPPNFLKGQKKRVLRIGLFYAAGATTFGPGGWMPVSIFGKVDQQSLDLLASKSQEVRRSGIQR